MYFYFTYKHNQKCDLTRVALTFYAKGKLHPVYLGSVNLTWTAYSIQELKTSILMKEKALLLTLCPCMSLSVTQHLSITHGMNSSPETHCKKLLGVT